MAAAPPLNELAEDYLLSKAIAAGSSTGNSDRARRQDLARWGRVLRTPKGQPADDETLNIETDLANLTPMSLSVEAIITGLDQLRRTYRSSTLQRLVSTLRGFCRWLVHRGYLDTSPFDDEMLHVTYRTEPEVRAFSVEDVTAMLEAAETHPPSATSAWAARDVAVIDVLAHCGLRAGELCAMQIQDLGTLDRPLLHVRRGVKGGRRREVPLPQHAKDRVEEYLAERGARGLRAGARTELFVRVDGTAMSTDALYHLVKRVATAAHVAMPDDALVHGLRHHYGLQLAIRGVPPATLQQLMGHSDPRTTALYTRHASHDLINALDDAGWLI